MSIAIPSWQVETRTKASVFFALAALLAVILAVAAPFLVSRSVIQDLFFILTMLVLAQTWNLLAGYAGLISVGQQLFVGVGAYAMFAFVILLGLDPIAAILIAGLFSAVDCYSDRLLHLPSLRPLFRDRHLGHRRGRAAAVCAVEDARRRYGNVAAA